FKKMGHVTIIVNNYQHLLNISDIKMTLEINKTATQADLGNSPFSLCRHRLESLCCPLTATRYHTELLGHSRKEVEKWRLIHQEQVDGRVIWGIS
ncbi:MAG: hypothetical protein AB1424_14605, partial [Thermodesulfobacteriota bacterium]